MRARSGDFEARNAKQDAKRFSVSSAVQCL
jgi:hypothetical protein